MGVEVEFEELDVLEIGLCGICGSMNFLFVVFIMWKWNFFFCDVDGFNVVDGKIWYSGVEVIFFL